MGRACSSEFATGPENMSHIRIFIFNAIKLIFKALLSTHKMVILTEFHDNWAKNVDLLL